MASSGRICGQPAGNRRDKGGIANVSGRIFHRKGSVGKIELCIAQWFGGIFIFGVIHGQ
jgi:hypothetical protein